MRRAPGEPPTVREERGEAARPGDGGAGEGGEGDGGMGKGGHPTIQHAAGASRLPVRVIPVRHALHRKMQSRIVACDEAPAGGR
ncbi:hypothetical protein [Streptomyces tubercidicus]